MPSPVQNIEALTPSAGREGRCRPTGRFFPPGNCSGQGLMEYIILLVLVGVASVAIIQRFGQSIKTRFENAEHHFVEKVRVPGT